MLFCEKFKFSEKRISNESCILPNFKNVKFILANSDVEVKPKLNAVQPSDKQSHPRKILEYKCGENKVQSIIFCNVMGNKYFFNGQEEQRVYLVL